MHAGVIIWFPLLPLENPVIQFHFHMCEPGHDPHPDDGAAWQHIQCNLLKCQYYPQCHACLDVPISSPTLDFDRCAHEYVVPLLFRLPEEC